MRQSRHCSVTSPQCCTNWSYVPKPHGSKLVLPAKARKKIIRVTHAGLGDGPPFLGNKRSSCGGGGPRRFGKPTSGFVLRRTAVTLTEVHPGNPLDGRAPGGRSP